MYIDFADVAERHDGRGLRAEDQNRADGISDVDVTRQDQTIDGADDGGIAQIFESVIKRGLGLGLLGFSFGDFRAGNGEIALRAHLFVQGQLIIFLSVFDYAFGHDTVFEHLLSTCHIEFEKRNVGAFRIDLVALQRSLCRLFCGGGGFQICTRLANNRFELNFVEFGEDLPGFHAITIVDVDLFDDTTGLRFDLSFRQRLDFSGGDDYAREIAALDGGDLGWIDFVAWTEGSLDAESRTKQDYQCYGSPDDAPAALLAVFAIC